MVIVSIYQVINALYLTPAYACIYPSACPAPGDLDMPVTQESDKEPRLAGSQSEEEPVRWPVS